MATIGTFTKDGNGFSGSIETLTLKAKITFEPNSKKSDNAPDYRVLLIADSFTSEIGAAWKKILQGGRWNTSRSASTIRASRRRSTAAW